VEVICSSKRGWDTWEVLSINPITTTPANKLLVYEFLFIKVQRGNKGNKTIRKDYTHVRL
jgi:hypothetical protein